MADPFVAEIRILPYSFPPRGWASCDGQLMPISQNTALFSLLGTMYGGDGKSTFALPDLQGRAAMQQGQGPGLSHYVQGETGGSMTVTLTESQMPAHKHSMNAHDNALQRANTSTPGPTMAFARANNTMPYQLDLDNAAPMASQVIGPEGGSGPHNNMQPSLVVQFCIALQGIFPPRS